MNSFKDKCQIFYMIKGSIDHVTPDTIESCYDGFVKRLWGNHEACYREEGFETAFEIYRKENK